MTTREPLVIGPFAKGMNTFDDPTAIDDQEVVDALNFDPGLDGSLTSRPPFVSVSGATRLIANSGKPRFLGWYYFSGDSYLIMSGGSMAGPSAGTYAFNVTTQSWSGITSTISASDMVQYDGKAWLLAPNGSANPGGYWNGSSFTADSDMPKGESIASYKSRLWIANGGSSGNPTRVQYSKVLGQSNFWASPGSINVGAGDGQSVIKLVNYFDVLLIFRAQSIWSFQYSIDPAQGVQGVLVPGVGLSDRWSLATSENFLYFMYNNSAYEFINNKATQINKKVPFTYDSADNGVTSFPYAVSVYADRVLYSYYDNIFVFSLRTRTWTRWLSTAIGPIAQITDPLTTGKDEAYCLPNAEIPDASVDRLNLHPNPKAGVDATGYSGIASGSSSYTFQRVALAGPGFGLTTGIRLTLGADMATWYGIRSANIPVTPGQVISASTYTNHNNSGDRNAELRFIWIDSGGSVLGESAAGSNAPLPSGTWQRRGGTLTVPTNAVNLRLDLRITNGGVSGTFLYATGFLVEISTSVGTYFDGDTSDGSTHYYRWTGAANLSTSSATTKRRVNILHIQEILTSDSEMFSCQLQTKNYSFSLAGSFKVLFWWGVDAVFRINVMGIASPIVFANSVTWKGIRQQGFTWGALRQNTWSHPAMEDPSVVTSVSIARTGATRKFVKFLKKMRFRQIFFRVRFDVDGTPNTSPVKIFGISAYMAEKQTVSKQVS